jgi:NAD(P) transhydrogenase subunit alpha
MDALSSQANIAGYKAVIIAAELLPKMFPLMMTPAGTITPAKVMIMGAGVAGLQAIATARRLGAVVEATDVRAAVKEQVESLGAKFVGLPPEPGMEDAGGYAKEQSADFLRRQQELVRKHVVAADVVITTALIPGRPAPRLVGADMVREMAAGSVIVDLAAERGGNCELTRPGEIAVENGVTIVGHRNVPALCPVVSSQMYARNVEKCLLQFWTKDGLAIDMNDEIAKGAIVTHEGSVRHAPSAERVAALGAK